VVLMIIGVGRLGVPMLTRIIQRETRGCPLADGLGRLGEAIEHVDGRVFLLRLQAPT